MNLVYFAQYNIGQTNIICLNLINSSIPRWNASPRGRRNKKKPGRQKIITSHHLPRLGIRPNISSVSLATPPSPEHRKRCFSNPQTLSAKTKLRARQPSPLLVKPGVTLPFGSGMINPLSRVRHLAAEAAPSDPTRHNFPTLLKDK
jgi:hypothetical protein